MEHAERAGDQSTETETAYRMNPNKRETHHIKVNDRTCAVVIEQDDARVLIKIRHDKSRRCKADKATVLEWLAEILARFEGDPRPIEVADF